MTWSPLDFGDSPPGGAALPPPEDCPIFMVDDEPAVARTVAEFLRDRGYPVEAFTAAEEALDALPGGNVALLISDIAMPGISGIELARRALEEDPSLAIIILTGVPDSTTAVQSLRLGVADYVTKPIEMASLEKVVQRTLLRRAQASYRQNLEKWLRDEVDRRTEELQSVTLSTLVALVRAMEAKDPYLKGDSERVAELAESLAIHLGLEPSEVEAVRVAGLLHDIGMISAPESILQKSSKLSAEEYERVKRHAEVGASILQPLAHLGGAVDYVRYHHERLNGSGYPEGRQGEEIQLGAQIVGLADFYVALTAARPYRPAHSCEEALEVLNASEGVWFHARLLGALERVVRNEKSDTS